MKLYEITNELRNILENLEINEDGEILNFEELENAEGLFEDKIEACSVVYKEKLAEIEALKHEEETLTQRRKALEKGAESFKGYIGNALLAVGRNKFETEKCKISFRKSTSVEIPDEYIEGLSEEYKTVKVEVKANKTAIKEALKNGIEIPGASLIEKNSPQIK